MNEAKCLVGSLPLKTQTKNVDSGHAGCLKYLETVFLVVTLYLKTLIVVNTFH